jgi:plastocyanin
VTFTWAPNSIAHGVQWLAGPGTLPANSAVQTSGTYQATFTTPGTYTYNCIVHGASMSGTVTVR